MTLLNVNVGIGRERGPITDAYTEFVLGLQLDAVPATVAEAAKLRLLDWLGVAVAGGSTPLADILVAVSGSFGGTPQVCVAGRGVSVPVHEAIFLNASMAQALDFDGALDSTVGPLAPVGSAVFGTAQWRPCSGSDLLVAFIAGYEVMGHIARPLGRLFQQNGMFANGFTAPFGAAAATSRLLGLDAERLRHAFGLAGSQSAGLRQTLGSMTKALMTGNAARNGFLAAAWAELGYTSSVRILDGEMSFPDTFLRASLAGTDTKLGEDWEILKSLMKLYPTCGGFPAAIECVLSLRDRENIDPSRIAHIVAELAPQTVTSAGDPHPLGAEAGRLSAQYVLAVVLYEGQVSRDTFTDEAVARPQMQELLSKIELDPVMKEVSESTVRIFMDDGRVFEHHVERAKGSADNPLTWDEVVSKFLANVEGVIDPGRAEKVVDLIGRIEAVPDASVVLPLCS